MKSVIRKLAEKIAEHRVYCTYYQYPFDYVRGCFCEFSARSTESFLIGRICEKHASGVFTCMCMCVCVIKIKRRYDVIPKASRVIITII